MNRSAAGQAPAAVLWDMDGTLVDSEKLWDIALHEAAAWLGGTVTPEQRAACVGSNMINTVRMLLENTGHAGGPDEIMEVEGWIRTRMTSLFADQLPWRPGARDALAALRSAGVPSALVTSTERSLTELALNTIGREFFDVVVCGDEVDGMNKPHPEPYLRAARLLEVDPQACVAVEDSPAGTRSAVAAGCTVLVVPGEVAVESGARRIFRTSLAGLDHTTLIELCSAKSRR